MAEAPPIDEARSVAARIAARAEIRDVRALSIRTQLGRDPEPGDRLTYHLTHSVTPEWDPENSRVLLTRGTYGLRISLVPNDGGSSETPDDVETTSDAETINEKLSERTAGDAENTSSLVATIDFELAALFTLDMREDDEPPQSEELDAYAQSTGVFALHPYARELVADQTTRLGLPPLTLGVYQVPITRD
ncbi:MAG: hypothetical protein ACOYBY_09090 [Dermatophilaceae bacterium]